MNTVVPKKLKRKSAIATLFAKRLSLAEMISDVNVVPKLAPRIIGIATSIGTKPLCANTTIIPVVTELECIIAVNRALTR